MTTEEVAVQESLSLKDKYFYAILNAVEFNSAAFDLYKLLIVDF